MRILVLSYHFPPFNVVASYRAKAYADYLPGYGIDTTIISHPWHEGKEQYTEEFIGKSKIVRIPRQFTKTALIFRKILSLPILRVLSNYLVMLLGFLDGNNIHVNYYYLYKKFLKDHLKDNHYDMVLPVFSPYHHIRLAVWIKRKYDIPFIADFRDLYDNRILDPNYSPSFHEHFLIIVRRHFLVSWLSESELIVSTSEAWAAHLASLVNKEGLEVLNGFEAEYFDELQGTERTERFTISSIGTMHSNQDWDSYFDVLTEFVRSHSNIKLNFVGLRQEWREKVNTWAAGFENDQLQIQILGRVPKTEIMAYYRQSSALLFPALIGSNGMYSAKILEYLASRVMILYYPDDGGLVADLINKHRAGYVCSTKAQLLHALEELYGKWNEHETVSSGLTPAQLHSYTREVQVGRLAQWLLKRNTTGRSIEGDKPMTDKQEITHEAGSPIRRDG